MSEQYDIRGVIFDLEEAVKCILRSPYGLKKHNDSDHFFPISASFEMPPKVTNEVVDLLCSIVSLNLPVHIFFNQEYDSFLSDLLKEWPGLGESYLISFSSIGKSSKSDYLNKNISLIAKNMQIPIDNLMVIGGLSYYYGMKFESTVSKSRNTNFEIAKNYQYNFFAKNLSDLLNIIKKKIVFKTGKLPNTFLAKLLTQYEFEDPSIIVGPCVGEDTAAVDITKDEVLLLKSDPITFTTDSIGYYSVLINSNDMVTSGAMPKWMLITLILPPGISFYKVQKIFEDLYETCSMFGISICGGHTEITDAVSRPVVVGTVVGTIERKKLLNKRDVRTGDVVLMTKGIAIEGTVVIASEFNKLLLSKGMSSSEIKECLELKSKISILNEAKIAWGNSGVRALHDVTEGGILTAMSELSEASGYGIDIDLDKIFIYQQTDYLCNLLDINPLGLIGSGALLICCEENKVSYLLDEINKSNIQIKTIGKISEKGGILKTYRNGVLDQIPRFEVDEIARLYESFSNTKRTFS